jgi:hypothetical protein
MLFDSQIISLSILIVLLIPHQLDVQGIRWYVSLPPKSRSSILFWPCLLLNPDPLVCLQSSPHRQCFFGSRGGEEGRGMSASPYHRVDNRVEEGTYIHR